MNPDFYVEGNLTKTKEELSPSGRFRLLIRYYKTKKGCWNYRVFWSVAILEKVYLLNTWK